MKTAVSIPTPLFKRGERLAKRLKIPRRTLYARALERYLAEMSEMSDDEITKRLNEIYDHEDSELEPVLAKLQFASIPREPW